MFMQTWNEIIITSFQNVWLQVASFLPKLTAALIILIIGSIIAIAIGKLIRLIVKNLQIDALLEKLGVMAFFQKGEIKFSFATLLGWLVKWFLIVVFLIAAAESLGLSQITEFLNKVVAYFPNVIVAVVILMIGIVLGSFVQNWFKKFLEASKVVSAHFLAGMAKWAIVIFSVLAALSQLKVATSLINTLFTGFVAMVTIAGGLAFGLGGKDWAEKLISQIRKDITKEE